MVVQCFEVFYRCQYEFLFFFCFCLLPKISALICFSVKFKFKCSVQHLLVSGKTFLHFQNVLTDKDRKFIMQHQQMSMYGNRFS